MIETLFFLTILIEALTEIMKGWVKPAPDSSVATWLLAHGIQVPMILSTVIGITLAVLTQVELFSTLGLKISVPWLAYVLTGIILSRGSNYLNDLIGLLGLTRPVGQLLSTMKRTGNMVTKGS